MKDLSNHAQKIATKLFADLVEREAFLEKIIKGSSGSPSIAWLKDRPAETPFEALTPFSWQPLWIDRVRVEDRVGKHALHESGAYYSLDISSVFSMVPVVETVAKIPCMIDMCASPGGKSVLAWRHASPEISVCNEVIRKRAAQLISNLKRCQIRPVVVTSRDTSIFSEAVPKAFPLVVVDAPCSGQSLVVRGMDSPGCWNPATINLNLKRQRRILANSASTVAKGGYLSYTTCTFSIEENEGVGEWFIKNFPDFSPVTVDRLSNYRSIYTDRAMYRLFPQHGEGAGAFTVLFKRDGEADSSEYFGIDDLDKVSVIWSLGVPGQEKVRADHILNRDRNKLKKGRR